MNKPLPLHLLYLELSDELYDKFCKLPGNKLDRLTKLDELFNKSIDNEEKLEINQIMLEIISGPNG